jgi:hypothetical protein
MHRPFTRRSPAAQARRTAVLRRHTPFTRCIPGPHASRTNVNISSGCAAGCCGCNGIPSLEEAKAKAKAIAISLVIFLSWVSSEKQLTNPN